ncbi:MULTISPECIES: AlpA family phage regulatory protein [Rahnella]|uniref:AlpA family phage regulatory protein n=1 Tax=Rahnella laticis TaxID=2787622 RepID=A0ABS0E7R3_9GAMM|nr:AlpA family phage regulatory protein [Rahnella laticis]MBF8001116.1 AlpA family phage regulatory protein [Rahnella sp. LAC-M12]
MVKNRHEAFTGLPSYENDKFPQSCKIGPISIACLENEIDEWITEKLS